MDHYSLCQRDQAWGQRISRGKLAVDMMDEEKLIIEVQNHSIIYDNSHRFYKDVYKKEIAWKDIAEAMGVDGKSLK